MPNAPMVTRLALLKTSLRKIGYYHLTLPIRDIQEIIEDIYGVELSKDLKEVYTACTIGEASGGMEGLEEKCGNKYTHNQVVEGELGKPHDIFQITCGDQEAGLYHQPYKSMNSRFRKVTDAKSGQLGTEGPVYGCKGPREKMNHADQ